MARKRAVVEKRDTIVQDAPPPQSDAYLALAGELDACKTVTDLFRTASSDDFRQDSSELSEIERDELRTYYRSRQTMLDGMVHLSEFDSVPVLIIGTEAWNSEFGPGVTLHFYPERDTSRTYKAMTSSAAIVRFAGKIGTPSATQPIKAVFALVPVADPVRAKQGQKRWSAKMLPMASGTVGSPF